MPKMLQILIVEDSPDDAEMVIAAVRRSGFDAQWTRVDTEADFVWELNKKPDIILSDYSMPHFSGLRAAEILQESSLDIPFILISGTVGEEVAVEAMKHGATDYLLKDRIARLGTSVQRALEQQQLRQRQKQAEIALRRTDEALRQMVAHSPAVIYTLKIEGKNVLPILVSENIERLLGFKVSEALSHDWWLQRLHPEDRKRALVAQDERLSGKDSASTEYRFQQKNGSYRWIEDSNRVVRDAFGQPKEIVGVWTDITERKGAEAALRESEEKFRQLAENINEVFWITDPSKNQMLYVSPAFERIWGRAPDSIYQSPQSWLEAIHPDDRPRIMEAAQTKQLQGQYDEIYRIIRPDGSIRWIHDKGFPVRNRLGELYRVVGTAEDITERQEMEQALQSSEADLRVIFDNAAIGMALVDLEGRPLKANRALQNLLGYSEEELRNKTFAELTHPDDMENHVALYQYLRTDSVGHYQLEKRYLRKQGGVVYARLTVSVVRNSSGKSQYGIGMVEDITEKKQLESQFMRIQRMENIGALAGGIAHDLNNVLAPILMSCELLQSQVNDESSRNLIGLIRGSADRGAQLVKQVLSFARGVEGRHISLQAKHLIHEMVGIARETFPKEVRVRSHIQNNLWVISGDPTQLHQVLLNLCVNARDAMPAGGDLKITAENVLMEATLPGLNHDTPTGPYVVIKVIDTGIGIPPEIQDKIFDPFFTTKEVGKGTGLGLSTTLGIVKSHRGFLKIFSEPGKGATFEVWLPASTNKVKDLPAIEAAPPPRGHGELILVVDDEAALRVMIRQTLEGYGYIVLTAVNGAEALAIYSKHKDAIKVVLTDMMMPVLDGSALTLALTRMNPAVRVIATSGLCNNETAAKALASGAKLFLPKPYNQEMLLNSLSDVIHDRPSAERS